ncbi:MAG: CCC motif membrane protein [Flavobacteriales bacterium]|nr:CCC motif membrane protein [Flavobacteriales bacterium]
MDENSSHDLEGNQSQAPSNNTNTVINQEALPNSTAILVLGIASIVTCCCYGLPGLICGIICLIMVKKANELYNLNPDNYTESSQKNMNAGKICGIIGLVLSILYFIMCIFSWIFQGAMLMGSGYPGMYY